MSGGTFRNPDSIEPPPTTAEILEACRSAVASFAALGPLPPPRLAWAHCRACGCISAEDASEVATRGRMVCRCGVVLFEIPPTAGAQKNVPNR